MKKFREAVLLLIGASFAIWMLAAAVKSILPYLLALFILLVVIGILIKRRID